MSIIVTPPSSMNISSSLFSPSSSSFKPKGPQVGSFRILYRPSVPSAVLKPNLVKPVSAQRSWKDSVVSCSAAIVAPEVAAKEEDYEQFAIDLENASPLEIIDRALQKFGNDIAIAFSGAEDVALIEYARLTGRPFRVFSLDTGRLNPENYRFFDSVEKHYGIHIEYMFPDAVEVQALVRSKGMFSFYEDGHQECCRVRKVRPLRRALKGLRAWITGQRKDQSPGTRSEIPVVQVDPVFEGLDGGIGSLVKWNPVANVNGNGIWNFLRTMNVPVNSLHLQGYVSIGCDPCTRPVLPGQHEREGRWWWEDAKAELSGKDSVIPRAATIIAPSTCCILPRAATIIAPKVAEKEEEYYEQLAVDLGNASPVEIIDKALERFGSDIAIAFSGAEDVALIEYARLTGRPFRVFSHTGRLNPETHRFFDSVEKHYGIHIECMFPDAIEGLRAWITGQRNDQSPRTGYKLPIVQVNPDSEGLDGGIGTLVKWNPVANVKGNDIRNFLGTLNVPVNSLHSQGCISPHTEFQGFWVFLLIYPWLLLLLCHTFQPINQPYRSIWNMRPSSLAQVSVILTVKTSKRNSGNRFLGGPFSDVIKIVSRYLNGDGTCSIEVHLKFNPDRLEEVRVKLLDNASDTDNDLLNAEIVAVRDATRGGISCWMTVRGGSRGDGGYVAEVDAANPNPQPGSYRNSGQQSMTGLVNSSGYTTGVGNNSININNYNNCNFGQQDSEK